MTPERWAIVIPMAGAGSRFAQAGYHVPKPFVPVRGRAMVEWVVQNMERPGVRYYLICRPAHVPHLGDTALLARDDLGVVLLDRPTEGCAETILRARGILDDPVLPVTVANCDQWVVYDRQRWRETTERCVGGAVTMTFQSAHPQHSYCRCEDDRVVEVAEKRVISDRANAGVYHFASGHLLVRYLSRMVRRGGRCGGEFYLAPVLNDLIADGLPVSQFPVEFRGMGTPEELQANYAAIGEGFGSDGGDGS